MEARGSVTNVGAVIRACGKAKAKAKYSLYEGIDKSGDVILKRMLELCPIDKGPLRASHKKETVGKGMAVRCTISAGGPEAPYAAWVHENHEAYHDPPTTAGWMTKAVRERRGTTANMVKRELEIGVSATVDGREYGT